MQGPKPSGLITESRQQLPASAEPHRTLRTAQSGRPQAILEVRAEDGTLVSHARIYRTSDVKRRVLRSAADSLAAAVGASALILDEDQVREVRSGGYSVSAPGFIPQPVPPAIVELDHTTTITLHKGASIQIRCVDLDGRPVASAHIAASRALLPNQRKCKEAEAPAPAANGRYSIHDAWTDETGMATVGGLQSGEEYEVQADVEGSVVWPKAGQEPIRAGSGVQEYIVSPILGAAVTATPSPLASAWFQIEDDLIALERAEKSEAARIRQEFSEKHSGCSVYLCARRKPGSAQAFVQLRAVTAAGDTIEHSIPLKPLWQVEALTLDSRPQKEAPPTRRLRILVENRNGEPLAIDSIRMTEKGRGFLGRTILVKPGEEHSVPLGEWIVSSPDTTIRALVEPRELDITVSSPESIRLVIKEEVRRCRIRVTGHDGVPVDRLFLRIKGTERPEQRVFVNNIQSFTPILPVGAITLEGQAFGFGTGTIECYVTGSLSDPPQEIELFLHD